MSTITFKPFEHWTRLPEFTREKVYQTENGKYITVGKDFDEKPKAFDVYIHKATGDVVHATRLFPALFQDLTGSALFLPHRIIAAFGNLGIRICEGVKGKEFSEREVKQIGTDVLLLGALGACTYYNVPVLTAARYAWYAFAFYSAYNPIGAKWQFSKLDRMLNPDALTDGQAPSHVGRDRAIALITGRWTLTRSLNMHCIGNVGEKRITIKK